MAAMRGGSTELLQNLSEDYMKLAFILIPALAAGVVLGKFAGLREMVHKPAASSTTVTNFVTNTVRVTVDLPATNVVAATNEAFAWGHLVSPDLKQYVANLRGVGCPEQTVRDIVLAIVNKQFAPRFAANKPQPQPYWQKRRRTYVNVEQAKELAAIEKERQAILKDLLGYEVKDADHRGYKPEERDEFTFLSAERRAALGDTLNNLRRQQEEKMAMYRAEVESRKGGEQEIAAMWRHLQREAREQLAGLLTKEELEEYDLRTSGTAQSLRYTLSGFEPTPEEFREVFRMQRELDERFKLDEIPERSLPADRRDEWKAAKQQMEEQVKEKLGEERFAEYQRSQDFDYQSLLRVVDSYGLKPEVPNQVWALREAVQAERSRILAQTGMTSEQQKAQLEQVAANARQQMIGLMGSGSFDRYQRVRGPNWWLTGLAKTGAAGNRNQ